MVLISHAPLGSSTWLLRLRSFASIGQLIAIVLANPVTSTALPLVPLLVFVALTACTNFVYGWWLSRYEHGVVVDANSVIPLRVAFALMALDLVTLTAMLYFSGGADNPFCFFYFVNLAVGGVMLQPVAAWALTGLAVLGYSVLLLESWPVRGLSVQTIDPSPVHLGELGMRDIASLLAFVACGTVITYFVARTSRQLRDREEDLRRSQSERADAMRLEGLTTLAAGAAHELATPLSTIDVACRELTRHLESVAKPESIDEDLRLIDGQLHMCRQILARMRSAAGDAVADQWNRTTLGELIDTTLDGIRDPHRVEILEPAGAWVLDPEHETATVDSRGGEIAGGGEIDLDTPAWERQPMWLPEEAVAQAIRNLIHNALDASGADETVTVQAERNGKEVTLRVVDQGHGMSSDVVDRAGDPFFTTKEPGRGIGLGLFLTRNVITRLGGRLSFDSVPGEGTTATVALPLASTVRSKPRYRG
ncbi:two-component system sensor histidine kinase RegB [Rhodopirellula rubra]|uniref:histidine kinase n=1 Tax=Aporhodopirellula rubra TaxID=980271 RepID=A0A7W5H957_9BACT|nr:ATP-binding protein [Aporhodopirellula rubra]MBB3209770.1 two-component system sensor histidine kinase RegB [Aporhodopirellula rubra]